MKPSIQFLKKKKKRHTPKKETLFRNHSYMNVDNEVYVLLRFSWRHLVVVEKIHSTVDYVLLAIRAPLFFVNIINGI